MKKLYTRIKVEKPIKPFPILGDDLYPATYGDKDNNIVCPHCKAVESFGEGTTRSDNRSNMPHLFGVLVSSNPTTRQIVTAVQARVCEDDVDSCDLEHAPKDVWEDASHMDTVGLHLCFECNHFFAVNSM